MSFILCKHMQFTQLSFNSYNRLFFQFVFKFSRKLKISSCYTTLVSGREEKLKTEQTFVCYYVIFFPGVVCTFIIVAHLDRYSILWNN